MFLPVAIGKGWSHLHFNLLCRARSITAQRTKQVAALPLQLFGGRPKVLLITSRYTGRWIMPKGWPMDGEQDWRTVEIEALAEAGLEDTVSRKPIGEFENAKTFNDGTSVQVKATVYPLYIDKVKRRWKERHERKRHWLSPKGTAKALKQPELEDLLLDLKNNPRKNRSIRAIAAA
ncbi:NUDIX hydrolase [Ruegeria arenilitoris]|uniref:NUDIX hydrolase n=1 Tax=Ruegeria arenilitoris TaxID=1173585 RepID=UPI003463A0EB